MCFKKSIHSTLLNKKKENDEDDLVEDEDEDDDEVDDDGDDEDDEEIDLNDADLDVDVDEREFDEEMRESKNDNLSSCSAENDDSEDLNDDLPPETKFNVKNRLNKDNVNKSLNKNNNNNTDADHLVYNDLNRLKNLNLNLDEENGEFLKGIIYFQK